jgi:hypothetical protein
VQVSKRVGEDHATGTDDHRRSEPLPTLDTVVDLASVAPLPAGAGSIHHRDEVNMFDAVLIWPTQDGNLTQQWSAKFPYPGTESGTTTLEVK